MEDNEEKPEKGLINVDLIFDHLLRARTDAAIILLLWLYLQRNSCAMILLQRKLENVMINNTAVYNNFNSAVYMISQSARWHLWNIHRYLALPNIVTVCFHCKNEHAKALICSAPSASWHSMVHMKAGKPPPPKTVILGQMPVRWQRLVHGIHLPELWSCTHTSLHVR